MEPMEQNKNSTALVVANEQRALVDVAEKRSGYWARVSRRYKLFARIVAISLVLFVLLFVATWSDAFSYDNVLYFGKDMGTLATLASEENSTIYYTYGKAGASVVSYRGGVGVVHSEGTEIYAPDGELLLFLTGEYKNPRAAASRDYFITYDFGGNSFVVCNSYAELYRGTTEHPIYRISVGDTGHFAVVTAPEATAQGSDLPLCEILVFNPSFNLVNRFGRAGATVDAAVSGSGRFVAIVDATASGALVEVFAIGTDSSTVSLTFDDFPYALAFTTDHMLALVGERATYTFDVDGELYGNLDYAGEVAYAFDFEEGVALLLRTDHVSESYRLVVMDEKGELRTSFPLDFAARSLSLVEDRVWLLGAGQLSCFSLEDDAMIDEQIIANGAVGVFSLSETAAQVVYPSQACKVHVKE